jgi:hypothetical protein
VKLALLLVLAACATDDPHVALPAAESQLGVCDWQAYNLQLASPAGTGPHWTGRMLTADDQCERINIEPPASATAGREGCAAFDPHYGVVMCDLSYQRGGLGSNGWWGCDVTSAAGDPVGSVDFAPCDVQP